MSVVKSLIVPFLIGGTIIAAVKYTAVHLKNPALAAIIGGFPTGLLSIYFVSQTQSAEYAHDYFYVTLILLTSIMVFYLLFTHTDWNKRIAWVVSVLFWVSLVIVRYFVAQKEKINGKKK